MAHKADLDGMKQTILLMVLMVDIKVSRNGAYIQDALTKNIITFNGEVTGLDKEYLAGISFASFNLYSTGTPQWQENYIDGLGNYVSASNSSPLFGRIMADYNKFSDIVVWVTVKDRDTMALIAERTFRIEYPNTVTALSPTKEYVKIEPPEEEEKAKITTALVIAGGAFAGLLLYLMAKKQA